MNEPENLPVQVIDAAIVIQVDGNFYSATAETWLKALRAMDEVQSLKATIEAQQRQINAREPKEWPERCASEIEKLGSEAQRMSSGDARLIMVGQAQAYNHAAAVLRGYFKTSER